jgi:hypothetical protein
MNAVLVLKFNQFNLEVNIIVNIEKTLVKIIFALHQIESEKGATKNNRFQKTKLKIISVRLFSLCAINNAQRLTMKLYQIKVYG